jgi:phospholipid/cholesterol/gamma-HCH transport system substrate-binding protein
MAISNETKVGILVVAALGGLAWLSVKSGSFGTSLATPMRDFTTSFNDVGGISKGSQVKMSGVPVGDVEDIQLQPTGTAIVKLRVKKDLQLPADVTAQIDSNGLIGDKFVSLVPGAQGRLGQSGPLPGNVTQIPGATAGAGGNPADKFGKVADDLQGMTENLRTVLGNPENAAKLQQIIDGMSTLSANLQGNSAEIIGNVKEASESLKQILDKVQDPHTPIGQLLASTGTSGTGNVLGDMQSTMKNLDEIAQKINSGQGTIGKLVNDPETANKLNGALDSLANITGKIDQFKTDVDFQAYSLMAEDAGKGQFGVTLQPTATRYYLLGLTADGLASNASDLDRQYDRQVYGKDFGKNLKFTAMFGHIWQGGFFGQDLGFRVGLKDSTGGIGFDTRMPGLEKLKIAADLYDWGGTHTPGTKNPHIDIKGMYPIVDGFYGIAGYDNILSSKYGSPLVGLGYHFEDEDLKYLMGKAL